MIDKATLRAKAAAVRSAAHQADPDAGQAIARNFLEALDWRQAGIISGYLPMGDEADILPLLRALSELGGDIALPVVPGKAVPLQFRRWRHGDSLEAGVFGTRHPPISAEIVEPDWLLVPMLAFDKAGYRLGYGGGYYDRTLAKLRRLGGITAIGIAYEAQYFEVLPSHAHDEKLDWIVTERQVREMVV